MHNKKRLNLKKLRDKAPRQILLLGDDDWCRVSVANTPDNWRETAVYYSGRYVKMWNHKTAIENSKTIEEALLVLKNIDSEWSERSDYTEI